MAIFLNSLIILIGGSIGLIFKKIIKENISKSILKSVGIVILIIGIAGVFKSMLKIVDGSIKTQYELLLIVSLAIGTLIGEILKLENKLEMFSIHLEKKFNGNNFADGFLNSTLIFCVGAMAIVGSFAAANGDNSIIYLKSIIDGFTAVILAATLGYGVLFSSIAVLLYQGTIFAISLIAGRFMSQELISIFGMIGYVLVACLGINFLVREKIKVVNMLPALIIGILYYFIFM